MPRLNQWRTAASYARLMEISAETSVASQSVRRWVAAFARYLPPRRPLTVLDVGCGTGRFAPALARAFGGPVYGVEPSGRRRAIAERDATHPAVTYLDGRADRIPLPRACSDAVLLFMSLHHMSVHSAVFTELARVSRPGSAVLVRCEFADRLPDSYLYRYFPTARTATAAARRPTADVIADARSAGLDLVALAALAIDSARPLREVYVRARELMTSRPGPVPPREVTAGLAAMALEAAADGGRLIKAPAADLLVLRRSGTP
jgi:SAM-dependent methyltransferase